MGSIAAPHRDHAQAQGGGRQRNTLRRVRRLPQHIEANERGFARTGTVQGLCSGSAGNRNADRYATAEGELASDLGAGAGPYARTLAEEIIKPGVEAVAMFRVVQRRVRMAIRQEPYLGFNAMGDVYLAGNAQTTVPRTGSCGGSA